MFRPVSELPRCADGAGQRAGGPPIRRLQITLPAGTPRVTVLLLPDCDGGGLALPVTPLDHWLARQPVRLTGVPRRGRRARGCGDAGCDAGVRLAKSKAKYYRSPPRSELDHG